MPPGGHLTRRWHLSGAPLRVDRVGGLTHVRFIAIQRLFIAVAIRGDRIAIPRVVVIPWVVIRAAIILGLVKRGVALLLRLQWRCLGPPNYRNLVANLPTSTSQSTT